MVVVITQDPSPARPGQGFIVRATGLAANHQYFTYFEVNIPVPVTENGVVITTTSAGVGTWGFTANSNADGQYTLKLADGANGALIDTAIITISPLTQECPPGFHLENGTCVPDTQPCATGFHLENGVCVPDVPVPPPPPGLDGGTIGLLVLGGLGLAMFLGSRK